MAIKERKAKYNQTIVKVYNPGNGLPAKIKVVQMAYLRTAGVEEEQSYEPSEGGVTAVNEEKLSNNVARARAMIFDLAYCNPWQFFFTGTIDGTKHDRTDLDNIMKKFSQWVRDLKRRKGYDIEYLLIPELHFDGVSWHLHGFLKGLPDSELEQFKIGDVMGAGIARKVKKGEEVYNWPAYAKRFGFCDLEPIRNHEACAKYVTKYITKELSRSVSDVGAHMYYRSKGLKTPEKVLQGTFGGYIEADYEGDYCSVLFTEFTTEFMQYLCENMIETGYSVCRNENPPIESPYKAVHGFSLVDDDFDLPEEWQKG